MMHMYECDNTAPTPGVGAHALSQPLVTANSKTPDWAIGKCWRQLSNGGLEE